jgi:sigma-B regulation protein RsbU (phosphoserine phosphatase)
MVMMRSIVAGLIARNPAADPKEVIRVLNATMYRAVQDRLGRSEHATVSLVRYHYDGTLHIAGKHEDIIVAGAAEKECRVVETPGTWVGLLPEIGQITDSMRYRLSPGDVVVLYSDGVIEARDANGELFGIRRLREVVDASRHLPVDQILERIYERVRAWEIRQYDDLTLLVLRYKGAGPDSSP